MVTSSARNHGSGTGACLAVFLIAGAPGCVQKPSGEGGVPERADTQMAASRSTSREADERRGSTPADTLGAMPSSSGKRTSTFPASERPNILFIMIDTLRYDGLGCNGCTRNTSPNLDKLAKEGIRFEHMIAAANWTMPSLMTMFTSLPPSLHDATNTKKRLAEGVTTIAAELRKNGYQTAGVNPNPMANGEFGFSLGFDLYDDHTIMLSSELNLFDDFDRRGRASTVTTSPLVNRVAFRWLERGRDPGRPFFLFVLYYDPHADYVPPPPYDRMFDDGCQSSVDGRMYGRKRKISEEADRDRIRALYDGEIRYTDEHVGKLLAKLDQLGLSKNTFVIVISDHGEEFWDHGGILHGTTLFKELIHVPCIIRWSGRAKPGTVVPGLVSHEDVMPTLLEVAGAPIPKQCRGHSFLPLLYGAKDRPRSEAYLEAKHLRGIRTRKASIVWNAKTGERHAYDLVADPGETRDVAMSRPARFEMLSARFDSWWAQIEKDKKAIKCAGRPRLKPETVRRIKELGYLQ